MCVCRKYVIAGASDGLMYAWSTGSGEQIPATPSALNLPVCASPVCEQTGAFVHAALFNPRMFLIAAVSSYPTQPSGSNVGVGAGAASSAAPGLSIELSFCLPGAQTLLPRA